MKIPKIRLEVVRYEYSQQNIVPKKFTNYIVDMNHLLFANDTDVYRGREKEVSRLFSCLLKTRNPNVMILGPHGVGKTTVVQSAVHHILKKKCPKDLRYDHFLFLDPEKILAIFSSDDDRHKNALSEAFKFLQSSTNIVVVLDQVHLMATSTSLMYYLSILLKSPNVKVIGISTEEDFYNYFAYQSKIFSLVEVLPIYEPEPKKVYPMISEYIQVLSQRHGVTMSEKMVRYTISVAAAFSSEIYNPGLTLDFVEKSMIMAKRRKHSEVTKKDVNSNFNFNYELFSKMSPDDKRITAYHEAGHFIVAKMSEHIRNYKTTAITIVPAESFLGLTMFEMEPEKQTSFTADYFIDNCAADLAGRVAESILQEGEGKDIKYTSGAYSDLKHATQTARDIVTEYGMIENCGSNMTYFCNYDLSDLALLSEERKSIIDVETQKLINQAYERAEKLLKENMDLLDLIASELLVNEILDEEDLDNLCSKVSRK